MTREVEGAEISVCDPVDATRGDVFSEDQIDAYVELKWEEVMRWETTPSPVEFDMYYSS